MAEDSFEKTKVRCAVNAKHVARAPGINAHLPTSPRAAVSQLLVFETDYVVHCRTGC